ncbi:MAG: hypothetical protein WCR69_05505 [Sulfuricurvum sp.]|jgi:hypothetical protein
MKEALKRYAVAISLLLFVVVLMLGATYGVTKLGQKMFEDSGIEIKPEGEKPSR